MSVSKRIGNWGRLGDYIERSMVNNTDLKYGPEFILGVNSNGEFCESKTNTFGINLKPYKIVQKGYFVYNPSRLNIGSLAIRKGPMCIVSHLYVVFKLNKKGEELIDNEYLEIFFNRKEFRRMINYLNFGSQRPEFNFFEMSEIEIPLPPIEVQKELVATYNGLRTLAEQNEALIEPLSKAFEACIIDCRKRYSIVELGDYIVEFDKRNTDNEVKLVKSVSVSKEFKETNAKVNKNELKGYKLVPPNHLAYVQTTKNEKCFANALNTTDETYVVSQVDKVVKSKDEQVLKIAYIHLIFRTKNFDRYAIFNSWGSAREIFDWSEFCRVKIPLPPIEVQQSIINLYDCLDEAKSIALEAREKLKSICPALIQRAINS